MYRGGRGRGIWAAPPKWGKEEAWRLRFPSLDVTAGGKKNPKGGQDRRSRIRREIIHAEGEGSRKGREGCSAISGCSWPLRVAEICDNQAQKHNFAKGEEFENSLVGKKNLLAERGLLP